MKNKVIRWIILGATVVAVGVAGFYAIAFNVDKKLNEDMFAKQDNVIIEYNDSEENIDIKQEDVSNVDTDQDTEVAKEEVKEEVNGFEFGDISSGDDYIDELAAANVVLAADEEIEAQDWVDESKSCYRVKVQYKEQPDHEYKHKRDYFFFVDNSVKPVMVDYPSKSDRNADRYVSHACDFNAHFEDVTFDGNDDLIISLGSDHNGSIFNCAYIYDDGQYVYNKSFEWIFAYKVDKENKKIIAEYNSTGSAVQKEVFEYQEDKKIFYEVDASYHMYDVNSLVDRIKKQGDINWYEDLYSLISPCENVPELQEKWNRTEVSKNHEAYLNVTNVNADGFDYKIEAYFDGNVGEVNGHASFASDNVAISIPNEGAYIVFEIEDGNMNIYNTHNVSGLGGNVYINGKYVTGQPEYIDADALN